MRGFLLALTLVAVAATPALAQTTELRPLLTWRAVTYVPDYYSRKALPIAGSDVIVALDLLDRGRPANLSSETVYWYLNDRFVSSGTGMTRISLKAPESAGRSVMEVRAVLPEFRGGIAKTIRVPIFSPEVVIDHSILNRRLTTTSFDLRAQAFFFNVSRIEELSIIWKANGKEPATFTDPEHLRVTLADNVLPRTTIPVSLRIQNPYASFEFATVETLFTYEP